MANPTADITAEPAAPDCRLRSRSVARTGLGLALLLATVLAVCLMDPTGWVGSDDSAYHAAAEQLLAGQMITRVHHHIGRMAVIVPIALSMAVFGNNVPAVILPTVVFALLTVLVTVWVGRHLWGPWEGWIAGAVVAFLPYFHAVATMAYPDVHACLFSAAAVLALLAAQRSASTKRRLLLTALAGVSLGLAVSAKAFTAVMIAPMGYLLWSDRRAGTTRWASLGGVLAGGTIFFLLHGGFYLYFTGDFWYKLHALQAMQVSTLYFPRQGYFGGASLPELIRERILFLFHPGTSGWGVLGTLFFPLLLMSLFQGRKGRMLALWAGVLYLSAAFLPCGPHGRYQPPPLFDGRNLLPAVVPFALMLAHHARLVLGTSIGETWTRRIVPVGVGLILAVSFLNPRELNGFRHRRTQRIAEALETLISRTDWEADRPIFLPASLYLRYRILFPPELRPRLRVAVDARAPIWWRDACGDILARTTRLERPAEAYLLVTPAQLLGEGEPWDYGARLPERDIAPWRGLARAVHEADLAAERRSRPRRRSLVWLLHGETLRRAVLRDDDRIETDAPQRTPETG